jgi:hypothetical protein
VEAPGRERLRLFTHQAGAAHDQPVTPVAGLGDLRDAAFGVGDADPGILCDCGDRGSDRRGLADRDGVVDLLAAAGLARLGRPEPESARMVSVPVAPARRTRAASSSTNLAVPRAVLARLARCRACSTSPLSARVATSEW